MPKKSKNHTKKSSSEKDDNIDYLTEDPVITEQQFMCISFLKPSSVDDKHKTDKKLTVCGVKIRGCYPTYEAAKARADYLTKCDPYHNIYIGEVGKWCPFEDDPEKAKDSEYMNKDLNKLMKSYWKQQSDANEYHELRKQEMTRKALEEVVRKKTEKAEAEADVETNAEADASNPEVESNTTSKTKKTKKVKDKKLESMKNQLESNKEDLDKEKREVDENINTLRRLEEELSEKIKELEEEAIRNALNSTLGADAQPNTQANAQL